VQFEQWLIHAKADIVLAAGPRPRLRAHPPRVQRRQRQPVPSKDAPVYITIGDSGNIDRGRSGRPAASATTRWTSRTARTPTTPGGTATGQDGAKVVADGVWLTNRYNMPTDDASVSCIALRSNRVRCSFIQLRWPSVPQPPHRPRQRTRHCHVTNTNSSGHLPKTIISQKIL
jgi:hypothetical protein